MAPSLPITRLPSVVLWVLCLGVTGFAAGFFGPMILAPGANQGPLVGILLSGPAGVALGLLLYVVVRFLQLSPTQERRVLWICCGALAIATLYFVTPGPVFDGYIEDVEIRSCKPPIQALGDAIKNWNERIAAAQVAARPGWQEDSREMLQNDDGVILDVFVIRARAVYRERKLWNKRRKLTSDWQMKDERKAFYARYAGGSCANYPVGKRALQFNEIYFSDTPYLGWPPRKVPTFLNLQMLQVLPPVDGDIGG